VVHEAADMRLAECGIELRMQDEVVPHAVNRSVHAISTRRIRRGQQQEAHELAPQSRCLRLIHLMPRRVSFDHGLRHGLQGRIHRAFGRRFRPDDDVEIGADRNVFVGHGLFGTKHGTTRGVYLWSCKA
jgi:hypothetical protein